MNKNLVVGLILAVLLLPWTAAAAGPDMNNLPIDQVCSQFLSTPAVGNAGPYVPPELLATLNTLCSPPQPPP